MLAQQFPNQLQNWTRKNDSTIIICINQMVMSNEGSKLSWDIPSIWALIFHPIATTVANWMQTCTCLICASWSPDMTPGHPGHGQSWGSRFVAFHSGCNNMREQSAIQKTSNFLLMTWAMIGLITKSRLCWSFIGLLPTPMLKSTISSSWMSFHDIPCQAHGAKKVVTNQQKSMGMLKWICNMNNFTLPQMYHV